MRNLYRLLVVIVLATPALFSLLPLVKAVPTLSPADIVRGQIALAFAILVFCGYVVYYLESATQRQVPVPISDTSLAVAAPAADVFSVCLQAAGNEGKIVQVESDERTCVVEIGNRRRPTLRMKISVVMTDAKSSIVKIQSHSRAIFYPFDKGDNARAVLALRDALRTHFDIPRRSRYNPDNLHW